MKVFFVLMLMVSFAAKASPFMTVKERLRLHLWVYGLEDSEPLKKKIPQQKKELPEEIERALRKI